MASGSFQSLRENVKYYNYLEYSILVRTKDFSTNFSKDLVYTDRHGYEFLSNSNLFGGELVLPNVGSIGKAFIVPKLAHRMTLAPNSIMVSFWKEEYIDWFYYIFNSPFGNELVHNISSSTAQMKFNKTDFKSLIVPIPPISEQRRIVNKIKELEPFINLYDKSQHHKDILNYEIRDRLKKSILQEAIQGKLVPQNPSEGTAEDLITQINAEKQRLVNQGVLKKSSVIGSTISKGSDGKYYERLGKAMHEIADEIPFDIPDSWEWTRLENICIYIQRGKSPKYSLVKKYPVIAQKCNQWSGFSVAKAQFIDPSTIDSYGEERFLQDGDLMWNSTGLGTLGRMAIYRENQNPYGIAVADSHVTVIRPMKHFVLSEYLYTYFSSNTVQSVIEDKADGSTKQKELSTETIKKYLLPLPPLHEQARIVDKINQLFKALK